jgi:hypothetical protein
MAVDTYAYRHTPVHIHVYSCVYLILHCDTKQKVNLSSTSGISGGSSAATSTHDTSQDQTVTLLNLLYANEGTPLHDLGHLLMRIEAPSHILVWTKVTEHTAHDMIITYASTIKLSLMQRFTSSVAIDSVCMHAVGSASVFACLHLVLFLCDLVRTSMFSKVLDITVKCAQSVCNGSLLTIITTATSDKSTRRWFD